MHELSISRNLIEIAEEHAEGRPVRRIRLRLGELSCVMPQALQFCFESVRENSIAAGAELEIDSVPGRAQCLECQQEFAMPPGGARCSCGGVRHQLLAGEELKVVELEFV